MVDVGAATGPASTAKRQSKTAIDAAAHADGEATAATTTANALGDDAARLIVSRRNGGEAVDRYIASVGAITGIAAEAYSNADAGRESRGHREATITATATDGLGLDARRK